MTEESIIKIVRTTQQPLQMGRFQKRRYTHALFLAAEFEMLKTTTMCSDADAR